MRIDEIQIRGVNGTGGGDFLLNSGPQLFNNPFVCSPGESCVFQHSITVDLGESNSSIPTQVFSSNRGAKQLRLSAIHNIYRAGTNNLIAEMRGILRVPIVFDIPEFSQESRSNSAYEGTESSGWLIQRPNPGAGGYSGVAVHEFGLNGNTEIGKLPIAPISKNDVMTFVIRADAGNCVRLCGEDEVQMDNLRGYINPTIHTGHGGGVICPEHNDNEGCKAFDTVPLADSPTSDQRYFITRNVDISHLEPGVHRILFTVEQPMFDSAQYPIEQEFQSTLNGLLIVRFIVTE